MPLEIPSSATTSIDQVTQGVNKFVELLTSSQLQQTLFPLRVIFIVISVVFLTVIVYFLAKTSFVDWWFLGFLKDFLFPKIVKQKRIIQKWKKIKTGIEKELEDQWKSSLIEASLLLDEILRDAGYSGQNLDERLKKLTEDDVTGLSQLIQAQGVCRDIIRDPDYRLSKERAQKIISVFEKALTDLDIL